MSIDKTRIGQERSLKPQKAEDESQKLFKRGGAESRSLALSNPFTEPHPLGRGELSSSLMIIPSTPLEDREVNAISAKVAKPKARQVKEIKEHANVVQKFKGMYAKAAAVRDGIVKAYKVGPRVATALTTLSSGLFRLVAGLFSFSPLGISLGGSQVAMGVVELVRIFRQVSIQESDAKQLLDDAQAGVKMIDQLRKDSARNISELKGQLGEIDAALSNLNKQMKEIASIAAYGQAEIEERKVQAEELLEQSKKTYEEAREKITTGLKELEAANKELTNIVEENLKLAQEILQQKEGVSAKEQSNLLASLLAKAEARILEAQAKITKGSASIAAAFRQFGQANGSNKQAQEVFSSIIALSEQYLKSIEEKTKLETDAQEKIDLAKSQIKVLEENNKVQGEIIEVVSQDLDVLSKNFEERFGTFSVILGGTLGGGLGALAGPKGAMVTAPLGVKLVHERRKIAGAIGRFFKGKDKAEEAGKPVYESEHFKFAFSQQSTGIWGRLKGRASRTIGTLFVTLPGGKEFSLKVNFAKSKPISPSELKQLSDELIALYSNEDLLKEEDVTKSILNELKAIEIERYAGKGKVSLIQDGEPMLHRLESRLGEKVALVFH